MDTVPLLCTRIRQVLYIIVQRKGKSYHFRDEVKCSVQDPVTLCSIYIFIDLYKKESLPHLTTKKREGRMPFVIKSNFDAWYFKVCAKTT